MGAKANAITSSMIKSMGMVAQAKATGLNYDRTQQMVVVAIEDADKNSYKVSDGNTTFVAFGADDVKYRVNDSVYVKIPTGNTTGRKIIIGKYTVEKEAATHSNSPLFNMIRMKEITRTDTVSLKIKHKEASRVEFTIPYSWLDIEGPFGVYDYVGIDIYFDAIGIQNNVEGQYYADISYGKRKTGGDFVSLIDFNIDSRGLYGNPNAATEFFKHTFYHSKDDYKDEIYEDRTFSQPFLKIVLRTNDAWDKDIIEEDGKIAIKKIVLWSAYDKNRFDKDQVYLYLKRTSSLSDKHGDCYIIENQRLLTAADDLSLIGFQRGSLDEDGQFFNRWKWESLTDVIPITTMSYCEIPWKYDKKKNPNPVIRLVYQHDNMVCYSPYLLNQQFLGKGTQYPLKDDAGHNLRSLEYLNYLYWILDVQFIKEVGYQENNFYKIPYYYYVSDITETFKPDEYPEFDLQYSINKILNNDLLEENGFNLIINDNQILSIDVETPPRITLKVLNENPMNDIGTINRFLDMGLYDDNRIVIEVDNTSHRTYYHYQLSNKDNYYFPFELPETYKHLKNVPSQEEQYKNAYRTDNTFCDFSLAMYCHETWGDDIAYKEIFNFTRQFQEYYNITTGYASKPQIYLDKYGSLGPASNSITITPKVMQRGFPQMTLGDFFSTYTIGCTWTPSSKIVVDKGNNSTITITSPFEYEIDRKNNSIIVSKSENLKLYDSNVYEMDKIIENHCVLMITVDGTIKFTDKIFHYEFYYPIGISNMGYNISEPTVKYNDIIKMSKNWTLIDTNGAMVPGITWQIKFKNRAVPFNYEINGTELGNVIVSDVNMSSINQSWHITDKDEDNVTITDDNNYNGKHMLEGYDKNDNLVWLSPFYAEPW